LHPGEIDWVIMGVYFVFVLGVGFTLRRYMKTSTDYFLSGRSIPAWVAGLAFLSANLGAQEVIGMAASGAKYGMATSHFYWVGAIPAMVFLGVFMMSHCCMPIRARWRRTSGPPSGRSACASS
jgi:SSS family solute:Na+ symporter